MPQYRKVTDPNLLSEIQDAFDSLDAGVDYDKAKKSSAYRSMRKHGSGFTGTNKTDEDGSYIKSLIRGMVHKPAMAINQGVMRLGRAVGLADDADVEHADAIPKITELRNQRGMEAHGRKGMDLIDLAGSLMTPLPFGRIRAGASAGRMAVQAAKQGAQAAALQPVMEPSDNFARDKIFQSGTGAIFGLGTGAAMGRIARGRTRVGPQPPTASEAIEAGERIGVPLGLGETARNRAVRSISDVSSNLPGGGALVRQGERTLDNFEGARDDLANQIGRGATQFDVGNAARRGTQGAVDRFQQEAGTRAGELTRLAGNREVDTVDTVLALRGRAAEFLSNPELGRELQNPRLRRFMETFVERGDDGAITGIRRMPFDEMQAFRSEIGRMMGDNEIVNSIPRAELARIYRATTNDLRSSLQGDAAALNQFDTFNRWYSRGRNRIDRVYKEILDPNATAEQIGGRVEAMLKNKSNHIRVLRRSMPPEEWDTIASSVFRRLGEVTPANAGASGEGVSVVKWLTDYNKLRKNRRAYDFLFSGTRYEPLRPILDDFATVADSISRGAVLANRSRSAYAGGTIGLVGSFFAGPTVPLKMIGSNLIFSRFMASPAVARWFVRAGRLVQGSQRRGMQASERLMRAHIARIPAIAAANGDIQEELSKFYSALMGGGEGAE
jgi:hypothetical protein